jgi:hypothetical protein
MIKTNIFSRSRNAPRQWVSEEDQAECYGRVDLTPSTLETLVTWDVSVHAQREQDRLSSVWRAPRTTRGGY